MVFPLLRQAAGVMEWWSGGVRKTYEIPNSKHQITNKSQIPIFNDQNTKQVWNFEFWSLWFV
jgi:hypothetical protein